LKLLDVGIRSKDAHHEVSLLKKLNIHTHLNIIKYYGDFIHSGFHCIVTEYCDWGDLKVLLKSFKDKTRENFLTANLRLMWSIELLSGLSYMHAQKVAHRDLTPNNIYLFTNKLKNNQISLKIGDFGLGKEKFKSYLKSFVGTFCYQSPEIIRNECYSFKTDVW